MEIVFSVSYKLRPEK